MQVPIVGESISIFICSGENFFFLQLRINSSADFSPVAVYVGVGLYPSWKLFVVVVYNIQNHKMEINIT